MDFLHILYPKRCILCRDVLKKDAGLLQLCGACLTKVFHGLDTVRQLDDECACVSATTYPVVRDAFLRYKFRHYPQAAETLGNLMVLAWQRHRADFPAPEAVTWVPVSFRRYLGRGYDQSLLLARVAAAQLDLPLVPTLVRRRHTARQEHLKTDAERADNVRGVFALRELSENYHHVLLVDDVVTSGATLREAILALRQGGIHCTALCLANARTDRGDTPVQTL